MGKVALITGITGQDASYLAKFLLDKKYTVYGTYRRASTPNFWRLLHLGIYNDIKLIPADLIDHMSLMEAVNISQPDEVYHLAAQSFVGAAFEQPIGTGMITGLGVSGMLESVRQIKPDAKFYQASTSELYGDKTNKGLQNEETPFTPSSPYACAKLYGYWMTRNYRDAYDMFTANGILFNHESPLRGLEFVTRKITNAVAKIEFGIEKELHLGNINSKRDWGYAPDYIKSMWLMLQRKEPDDYVIATGETHSVEEFMQKAFDIVGLSAEDYLKVDKRCMRPLDVNYLYGDSAKAKKNLGWSPKIKFDALIKIMVNEDIKRWGDWDEGKSFPWDALNYPTEANIITKGLRV